MSRGPWHVLAGESAAALGAAMAGLAAGPRECGRLRFGREVSIPRTAEVMDRAEGAVQALTHQAVRRLAHHLHLQGVGSW